jgi:hypothetical protein
MSALACKIQRICPAPLIARLDRLGAAKEVLQIAAVIGGEFSYELLHAVHPIPEEALQHMLHSLTDAELLYVHGVAPDASYLSASYPVLVKAPLTQRGEFQLIKRGEFRVIIDTADYTLAALSESRAFNRR